MSNLDEKITSTYNQVISCFFNNRSATPNLENLQIIFSIKKKIEKLYISSRVSVNKLNTLSGSWMIKVLKFNIFISTTTIDVFRKIIVIFIYNLKLV